MDFFYFFGDLQLGSVCVIYPSKDQLMCCDNLLINCILKLSGILKPTTHDSTVMFKA